MRLNAADTVALVPLNASAASKTRLRSALRGSEREALARWLARRVLAAIESSRSVARTAVVSPDAEVLEWARGLGAVPLVQREGGLNDGLELGRRWALDEGAGALLIVLGDLPLVSSREIEELVRLGQAPDDRRVVVLAPDREGRGTNAMVQRPVSLAPFAFGEGSFQRHRELIQAAGAELQLYRSPGTDFDLDTPSDLAELRARKLWPEGAGAGEVPEPERNAS